MTDFNLDIPKMGYFMVVKHDHGPFGDLIIGEQIKRGFDIKDARYTHVEVLGGGPYSIRVAAPFTRVVKFPDKYKGKYVKILSYNKPNYNYRRNKVAFWAASNCNLRYDWLGVLKFKIGLIFHRKNKFFCSENSLWALQKEYPTALNMPPYRCMPADFLRKDHFEVVWEGVLP